MKISKYYKSNKYYQIVMDDAIRHQKYHLEEHEDKDMCSYWHGIKNGNIDACITYLIYIKNVQLKDAVDIVSDDFAILVKEKGLVV